MAENIDLIQSDSSDSAVDSSDLAKGESKIELLSKLLERESIAKNNNGQFLPNNKQLKDLVNCIDNATGKPISLERIDTSKITSMKELFANSNRTDFSGIESWDTSNVTSFAYAFSRAEHFDSDISQWNVSKGKSFYYMFFRALKFNQPIGELWDTSSAVNMRAMFCFAINFNNGGKPFGDKWKMDNVEISAEMFYNAKNFNAEGLNKWNMSNIRKCWSMFNGAKAFNQPLDKWDLSNNETFWGMFYDAESFNQDLSAWGNKLSKARDMSKIFADTKALDINFLQDWQIPADCIIENIIKGSKLEQILKNPKAQNVENKTQDKKRKLKDIAKFTISQIKNSNILKETCENLSKNNGFVVNQKSWIPNNILNGYNVYLGKDNDDINGKDKIIKADIDDFNYAFCKVFDDINLIISIDDANSPFGGIEKINKFEVYQAKDIKEFKELNGDDEVNKYDKSHIIKDIEFYLADDSMLIINKNDKIGDNSNIISDIISAYILAKAYKAKMQQLNMRASEYKEKNWCGKILDFLCFWKSDVLHQVHKDICTFDLKYYQKDPVDKNKTVLDMWREMSKSYLVAQTHDELKETIKQVAELVSEENQKKFNYLMLAVAVFSALGAILAAVPVAQSLLN